MSFEDPGDKVTSYYNMGPQEHLHTTPYQKRKGILDNTSDVTQVKRQYSSSNRKPGDVPVIWNNSDATPFITLGNSNRGSSTEETGICRNLFNHNKNNVMTYSRSNSEDSLLVPELFSFENPCRNTGSCTDNINSIPNMALKSKAISRPNSMSRSCTKPTSCSTEGHISSLSSEGLKLKANQSNYRAQVSKETQCFENETPLILATARQTGSAISSSCNKDSIRQLQNPDSFQRSLTSSEYFVKKKLSTSSLWEKRRAAESSASSTTRSSISSTSVTNDADDDDGISRSDVDQIRTTVRDTSSSDSQVYIGIMWHTGKMGVAYYDVDTTQVHVMLDTQETDEFKLLLRVIKQVNPSQIILSSKQDERLLQVLRTYVSNVTNAAADSMEGNNNMLQFLPSIDFSIEICKRRVLSIDLPSIPDHFMDTERTMYMSSLIPFENSCMVRAMGGLLKYLEKMRIGIELEEMGTKLPILDVKIFTLESQMVLDDTAFSALQIFQREFHPSVYKTGSSNSAKEGLSLFGIMNRTKSQIGSRMLRTWFQRPLKNLDMIRGRHDAVAYFNNPRNIEVVQTLEESVKHVKNISKILTRMMQSEASVGDWQALFKTVYNATCIKEICKMQSQNIEIFSKVTEQFSDDLHKITNFIKKIVDFQESSLQGRFVVKPNVDARLDKKKRIFSGLPDFMTKVAHEELNKLGNEVTECSVLYMPQIGYLLAIPETAIRADPDDNHQIEGLEFVFESNNMLNYRNACTRELDSLLGDTRCDITDMETVIMHKLQNIILEHTDILMAVLDLTAELDCLLALSTCAREYGYVRPTMTQDNVVEVTGGRHPIQEVCCSTFVPNDIQSNDEYGKIKVLTGPNACGKSVYLKQVALIVYLAQIGSFVPAEEATLGLIDRIFTRVRSLESVSVGLSTFMIDINQMAEALRSAGERSMCIVDEFGKGTDMIDGVSLLCSCLSYWTKQSECPHIFVCTHFHSIIHQHLLPRSPQIKYMTLETLHNGQELVFLYQLTEGHTSSSYACHVAAQAGLPQEIVKRGIEASDLIRQCKPIQRVDTVGTETHYKRCTTIVTKFLDLDLETAVVKSFLSDFVLPTIEGKL